MLEACARPLLIPSAEPNGRRASVQEPLATWDKTNILPFFFLRPILLRWRQEDGHTVGCWSCLVEANGRGAISVPGHWVKMVTDGRTMRVTGNCLQTLSSCSSSNTSSDL